MANNRTRNFKCLLGFLALTSAAALTPVAEAKPTIPTQTLLNRSGLQIESTTSTTPREATFKPSLETIKPNIGRAANDGSCDGTCNGLCSKKPTETFTNRANPINHSIRQFQQ
ncbi:hypothetical protein [Crocosphaera chwakensis]|uniref:Uncharacterized protein n=1 Tax=Crocosphaera chwakensis CCY0110 TaxID=391612 RepID=A3IY87_9CHRO|nr:hypothetical protein [Crocosphaera chwakensis]EAZ88570.1 hypothetical protein CY0110_21612 [Crocosphaera chwakensis CCY0110]